MAWLISQPPVVDRHRTSGRFDAANVASLVRGDGRCFARRPDDGEGRVCLTLLVDCSGSMGGWTMDSVKGAAFALASAFRSSRFVDVVVIGHDVMSRGTVDIHDCGDDARNIAGLDARGNNADGFAISAADSIARSRFPRHRHAMILLADGAPSDSGYHGCQALQHVRQTIANLGGAFHAIGWGIPNATARQQWGEAFTPIQSASDLVEPLVSAVGRIIQATREDA